MPSKGDMALAYAHLGWRVFPCCWPDRDGNCDCGRHHEKRIGKAPLTRNGLLDATATPDVVRAIWKLTPNANIGVRTGFVSGIVVLDVDADKGGEDSLREFQSNYQPLPDTLESLTGGGGRHLFFRHTSALLEAPNATGFLNYDGLDVRGDGGYVIAPPSLHRSGREYAWELSHELCFEAIAPMPIWLQELLCKQKSTRRLGTAAPIHVSLDIVARAAEALNRLAPRRCQEYQQWIEVGMCLQSLGDMGLMLWNIWSQGAPDKYDPEACDFHWRTFDKDGLNLGHLQKWALEDQPRGVAKIRGVDL